MARYGRADVRETAPVDAMIGQVAAAWGGVDVLVHNALTPYAIKPFREMTWDELGGKLDDEMRAAFTVTKAVLPTMTERRQGRLIYLGTGLSRRPRAGMIALGTAKAALTQFARYLAQELGPQGITVNVVEPGPVAETRISRVLDDEQRNRQIAATPLGRLAVPADVATVVAFYAGEDEGRPPAWAALTGSRPGRSRPPGRRRPLRVRPARRTRRLRSPPGTGAASRCRR